MSKKDFLSQRLAERDSVNTPWNKKPNPKAEELLKGDGKIPVVSEEEDE